MKAAVLEAYGQPLNVTDVDLAGPQAHEVQVAIRATGVCHSDLSIQQGKLPYPTPVVLGHEGAGEVIEVGDGVTNVKPGDHVVVMWTPMCGQCFMCRRGQTHLCEGVRAMGMMDDGTSRLSKDGKLILHGINAATFAEEAILRDYAVVKIPDDVPFEVAAVVGCGVLTGVGAAINTAKAASGRVGRRDRLRRRRHQRDPRSPARGSEPDHRGRHRRGEARHGGAVRRDASRQRVGRRTPSPQCIELTGGRGVDASFEVVGVPALQRQAFDMSRRGGARSSSASPASPTRSRCRRCSSRSARRTSSGATTARATRSATSRASSNLWRAGKLDLEGLVSQTSKLDDVNGAFEDMEAGKVIRTVLIP